PPGMGPNPPSRRSTRVRRLLERRFGRGTRWSVRWTRPNGCRSVGFPPSRGVRCGQWMPVAGFDPAFGRFVDRWPHSSQLDRDIGWTHRVTAESVPPGTHHAYRALPEEAHHRATRWPIACRRDYDVLAPADRS